VVSKLASPIRGISKPAAASSHLPTPTSPSAVGKPKGLPISRLGVPRSRANDTQPPRAVFAAQTELEDDLFSEEPPHTNGNGHLHHDRDLDGPIHAEPRGDDITIAISSILSNDPSRSVDALKKIQKVLEIPPEDGPSSADYRELAEHTEGLIETITLQMAHVFERPEDVAVYENFRLAKHLIQTLNAFCDHVFLAESLTVDILTSLLEELTLRLLQTDNSPETKVKDLSRFINMIILRIFATGRRMSVFRYVDTCIYNMTTPILRSQSIVRLTPSNCQAFPQ
jgi:cytoskeleton-associated protein 5